MLDAWVKNAKMHCFTAVFSAFSCPAGCSAQGPRFYFLVKVFCKAFPGRYRRRGQTKFILLCSLFGGLTLTLRWSELLALANFPAPYYLHVFYFYTRFYISCLLNIWRFRVSAGIDLTKIGLALFSHKRCLLRVLAKGARLWCLYPLPLHYIV